MPALVAIAILLGCFPARASSPASPSTVSVWCGGEWRTWWTSDRAPTRWGAPDSLVTGALRWRRLGRGLEWSSLRLACGGPAWRVRAIVVRLDPHDLRLSLEMDLTRGSGQPAWTIDRAPPDAVLAVNAGQFVTAMPWGWVVIDGVQRLRPGLGPLSSAIGIDAAGRLTWVHGDTLAMPAPVLTGFQSYPTLLAGDGLVPAALRQGGRGVSLSHRDGRLALGQTREGRLLLVLTRFDVVGEAAGGMPLGLSTPEMAALMGALGACEAVMLDGGISAQLLLRDSHGNALRWPGLRKVPLALIARPRDVGSR